jgi:hypothetical protein
MSSVHVHIATGEVTAKNYVKLIVKDHVMWKQELAVFVTMAFGILIVIKTVQQIVARHDVANTMEVVILVPMVGMVSCATIHVI